MAYCCEVVCLNRAGRWIAPGSDWHLAHDPAGTFYVGVSHARCNESEGGSRSRQGYRPGRPGRATPKPRSWRPTRAW